MRVRRCKRNCCDFVFVSRMGDVGGVCKVCNVLLYGEGSLISVIGLCTTVEYVVVFFIIIYNGDGGCFGCGLVRWWLLKGGLLFWCILGDFVKFEILYSEGLCNNVGNDRGGMSCFTNTGEC